MLEAVCDQGQKVKDSLLTCSSTVLLPYENVQLAVPVLFLGLTALALELACIIIMRSMVGHLHTVMCSLKNIHCFSMPSPVWSSFKQTSSVTFNATVCLLTLEGFVMYGI